MLTLTPSPKFSQGYKYHKIIYPIVFRLMFVLSRSKPLMSSCRFWPTRSSSTHSLLQLPHFPGLWVTSSSVPSKRCYILRHLSRNTASFNKNRMRSWHTLAIPILKPMETLHFQGTLGLRRLRVDVRSFGSPAASMGNWQLARQLLVRAESDGVQLDVQCFTAGPADPVVLLHLTAERRWTCRKLLSPLNGRPILCFEV